jgi:hypothetical protein
VENGAFSADGKARDKCTPRFIRSVEAADLPYGFRDTKTTTFRWGPIKGISFQQCILQCGKLDGCTVASYDGTCYLRQSAKNKGYVNKGGASRVAVKMN